MATAAVFFDKAHPRKDGTCAISIRVIHERLSYLFPVKIRLSTDDFNEINTIKIPKKLQDVSIKINHRLKTALDIIKELDEDFTWERFREMFQSNKMSKVGLKELFEEHINNKKKYGSIKTAISYQTTYNSLSLYRTDLELKDITQTFLKDYERFMLANNKSKTTIGIYLRSLRTIMNIAKEKRLLKEENYPFGRNRYQSPIGINEKLALDIEEIQQIKCYNFDVPQSEKARDFWMFSYYCNGINFIDLCNLKYKNINEDMMTFERIKTKNTNRKTILIKAFINDEMKEIFRKYGNKDNSPENFIFSIIDKNDSDEIKQKKVENFIKTTNKYNKRLGVALKLKVELTTYVARHSFATILLRSGAKTEFIQQALGHSSIMTTEVYLGGFPNKFIQERMKALTKFE